MKKNAKFYNLENEFLKVVFCDVGASIVSIIIKEKDLDVVLGYEKPSDYYQFGTYFGAICGLNANRIAKGRFKLNDCEYQLDINNGPNHLHGGENGISIQKWNVSEFDNKIIFDLITLNSKTGYPGDQELRVTYTLEGYRLTVDYFGATSEDTIMNLTNHSYFNLNGHDSGDILKHQLKLNCSKFVPIDSDGIPLGHYQDVMNTPMDFLNFKEIGQDILANDLQIKNGSGYDHSFVGTGHIATLSGDRSNIQLDVYSDFPGVQLYSGNWIADVVGKNAIYQKHSGLAIETQYHPDAINQVNFEKPILKKGENYTKKCVFEFSIN